MHAMLGNHLALDFTLQQTAIVGERRRGIKSEMVELGTFQLGGRVGGSAPKRPTNRNTK